MSAPIDLSNCASLEQQHLATAEALADKQRDETTNPNNNNVITQSQNDDIPEQWDISASILTSTTFDPATGTITLQAQEVFS